MRQHARHALGGSVGGATTRNIKDPAGAKRALLRGQPGHQRGNLGGLPKASHWNARQHVLEFISLSFWYDAPLTSQDSDRRHDSWLVYGSPICSLAPPSSWISPAWPSTSFGSWSRPLRRRSTHG